MAKRRAKTSPPKVPPIGARVRMRFGVADVVATVTEHRGPLGVGGMELLRVSFQFEGANEPIETEVPVDEVSLVGSAAHSPARSTSGHTATSIRAPDRRRGGH